jgi:membrane fusion protein, copper/silver efflux system
MWLGTSRAARLEIGHAGPSGDFDVTASAPNRHRQFSFVAGVTVGLVLGAGALYAHFSGFLDPAYRLVGLGAQISEGQKHDASMNPASEHAGHAGMDMGGTPNESKQVDGYTLVDVSPLKQQLIGVRVGTVAEDRLLMFIRTVGILEPDQTRLGRIHTRIKGWVTKTYVNFIGETVDKNQPLIEVYSPELLTAQEEYLIARTGVERPGLGRGERELMESVRRRLELWGVSQAEMLELERTKKARDTLVLRSPLRGQVLQRHVVDGSYVEPDMELYQIADLSVLWLQARIYEYELPHVEIGQSVRVTLPSQPGEEFHGRVSFIEPVLQQETRTVKVRVEVDNAQSRLKPGMYADLWIDHDMGKGLLVPESAVLRTGERAIAFRALGEGRFEPVDVKLGSRFGERFQVLGGLKAGDEVVVSGNFLIDSESRLKAATGTMGHHHH